MLAIRDDPEYEKRLADLQYTIDQLKQASHPRQHSTWTEFSEESFLECPPFVFTRPTRVDQRRVAGPKDKLYDFERFKHQLPIVPTPPKGYSFASILNALDLPSVQIRVIWDGGAEATSISDGAMSRILRAQEGKAPHLCALNAM